MPQDDNAAANLPEARLGRTPTGRRGRLSAQLKTVIELMAYEGLPLPVAAERANMAVASAKDAFRKPHVKQALNQLVTEIRSGAAQAAYLRINHMSHSVSSEDVKLRANQWVAGVDGIAAVKKVEGRHTHNHTFGGFEFGGETIEGEAAQDGASGGDDD